MIAYLKAFVADWKVLPNDRGPIARAFYAHLTAMGMD